MLKRRQLLLATAALPLIARPAVAISSTVEFRRYPSRLLGRPLPYLTHKAGPAGPASPVVHLLHGHGGNERDWLRAGNIVELVNQMVADSLLPPLFLVMPGVGNSWYVDSPHTRMASALLYELIPAAERRLGVAPGPRALIGLSMGGWGALHLGLREPARWSFIGAMSPTVFTPHAVLSEQQIRLLSGAFGDPFQPERLAFADPFHLIGRLGRAERLPTVHLACGAEDHLGLAESTRALHQALVDARVPASLRIVPGGHNWPFWRAELPETLSAFARTLPDAPDQVRQSRAEDEQPA